MYREQEFVERCFCNEPATLPCACCGRARCALHLERGLCNRCSQAVGREMASSTGTSWAIGLTTAMTLTFALLIAGVVGSALLALPFGLAAGLGRHVVRRGRLIRRLGPTMSALKGELPAPSRESEVGNDGAGSGPPGTLGSHR